MSENPVSLPRPALLRKSGSLALFAAESPEGAAPYARFRLCRGYIDDLNRVLPIRLRIQLESEITQGLSRGVLEAPGLRFRWVFREA
jgi:hypothetical protein